MCACVCVCVRVRARACVCLYVKSFLQNGESDHHQIWLAHLESVQVESEPIVVSRTSPATTRFHRLHLRANIYATAYRISTQFKLPVPDTGRYARSVSFIAADFGKRRYVCLYPSLEKTPTAVCPSTPVKELPRSIQLFPAATSSKWRRSARQSKWRQLARVVTWYIYGEPIIRVSANCT